MPAMLAPAASEGAALRTGGEFDLLTVEAANSDRVAHVGLLDGSKMGEWQKTTGKNWQSKLRTTRV